MPELPEVEDARSTIERAALGRRIAAVDDSDEWECRPHRPGDIGAALVGRELTAACRIGKSMWCETSGLGRAGGPGPRLGLHLGMSGRIVVTGDAGVDEGGDWLGGGRRAHTQSEEHPVWNRFTLTFADGGQLRLFDKRRLGRVRLDPDLAALGPDAGQVRVAAFRQRVGRGTAPVKARLLDQTVLAGVGNLLADEILWQAEISPRRRADALDADDLTRLHRATRAAVRTAIRRGGVHRLDFVEHRGRDGHCPRCGAELSVATVGGRTTYWCPAEQQ